MPKKDYELIASVVFVIMDDDLRRHIAGMFAMRFSRINRRFDERKFFTACGVNS